MTKKQRNKDEKSTRKPIWPYVTSVITVCMLSLTAIGFYEYEQLQPAHHFKRTHPVVPIAASTSANQASVASETGRGMPSSGAPSMTPQPVAPQPSGVINVLLIGSDERPGQTVGHSDSMIIIHINFQTHAYNLLSVPRDTRVYMQGYGYTKLTSVQYMGQAAHGTVTGIQESIAAISQLTDIPIDYYAETNYWGLQDMIDVLGGIMMDVPFQVTLTQAWYPQDEGKVISTGSHFFDGKMVTEIVHERYSVPGTDYGRQQLQEAALLGITKTLLQPANITKIHQVYAQMSKYLIATNISPKDALSMVVGVQNLRQSEIHYYQIPASNRVMYDDILKADNDELVIDKTALKQLVAQHFRK